MERLKHVVGHLCPEPASSEKNLVVTLIASGNSGHVCAALFEGNTGGRVRTQVLTSQPHIWKSKRPIVRFPDGSFQTGSIDFVSDDPAELIPKSDIVLWTGPVNATKEMFENIRDYLDPRRTVVGTIFAQGLVHMLAHRTFGSGVRFFALRNIPWLCRVVEVGRESEVIGTKASIGVTAINLDEAWVKRELEPLFAVQRDGKKEPVLELLPDFCPIVFNPANQIIHPARYWALFRNWRGQPLTGADEPSEWLYRNMDEVAGQVLTVLDEELQHLKDAYLAATGAEGCKSVVPLRERLMDQYKDQIEDYSTLARMVGTNRAYSMAKTPVIRTQLGVMPNPNHRVVTDDIGWGLCALISVAERLESAGIQTPTTMMRSMVEWHQKMMGKEYLYNGRLTGRDCAELVLLRPGDPLELVARPPATSPRAWLSSVEMVADENRIGNP
uniref:Opine dehydrogenase domain-containing protein n=1 Tax=Alexandrium andersonii TaxID=327968 RepID=A0A7S2DZE5_9DINO|mmetsp:Transcript_6230/g.14202  ORF Transcript_6230/g.14202 Transcript_6230/m.14202 type:complete len:442 (+) Transcript_6230:58-1383(+)